MKIGLVPISGKPVHIGHWGLIEIASRENDEVRLYVSISDRKRKGEMTIYGEDMKKVWDKFLEPALPTNVTVEYGGSPVEKVLHELSTAETLNSIDEYQIYSDAEDILKYTDQLLTKSAPQMFQSGQITRRGVERGGETIDVSGTKMRDILKNGQIKLFGSLLPQPVQSHASEIAEMLTHRMNESTLRQYVRNVLVRSALERTRRGLFLVERR